MRAIFARGINAAAEVSQGETIEVDRGVNVTKALLGVAKGDHLSFALTQFFRTASPRGHAFLSRLVSILFGGLTETSLVQIFDFLNNVLLALKVPPILLDLSWSEANHLVLI